MSYLLMILEPRGQRAERTPAEGEALYTQMLAFGDSLKSRGKLVISQSLKTDDDAVRVQVRQKKAALRDGPFAEAREMVGGFFLLEHVTREEALAIAGECPAAAWATVEVRELGPCFS